MTCIADNCSWVGLDIGQACTVAVRYHPTHRLGPQSAALVITDDVAPAGGLGHRVTLTGKQPENTGLLRQAVVLEQGKRYTLRWKARTTGLTKPSGLNWNAGNASEAVEPSNDWSAGSLTFTAGATLVPMVLTYRRPQGVPRAEGSVDVTELSLTLADAATCSAK